MHQPISVAEQKGHTPLHSAHYRTTVTFKKWKVHQMKCCINHSYPKMLSEWDKDFKTPWCSTACPHLHYCTPAMTLTFRWPQSLIRTSSDEANIKVTILITDTIISVIVLITDTIINHHCCYGANLILKGDVNVHHLEGAAAGWKVEWLILSSLQRTLLKQFGPSS